MKKEEITSRIKKSLTGKKIWAFSGGAGSYFHMHLGKMIQRKRKIDNPNLDHDLQEFKGEYIIDVYSDTWKIMLSSIHILNSDSDDLRDMIPEFKKLKDVIIDDLSIGPGNELKLTLSNSYEIEVKCSDKNHWDYCENGLFYSFFENKIDIE
jgi:hypothetical protein